MISGEGSGYGCISGFDPYPGHFAWLKIWWCNRNPRLLINYYLEAGRKVKGMSRELFWFSNGLNGHLQVFRLSQWVTLGEKTMGLPTCTLWCVINLIPPYATLYSTASVTTRKTSNPKLAGPNFELNGPLASRISLISVSTQGYTLHRTLSKSMCIDSSLVQTHSLEIVWSSDGLWFHGSKLRLTNGLPCTTLALDEPTDRRLYHMEYLI